MQTETKITQLLAQRAAEWMETLQAGDPRDQAAFIAWLRESKLHVSSYLEMEALDRQIQALDAAARPDIEAILAASSNVRALDMRAGGHPAPRRGWGGWVLAAAMSFVVLGLALFAYRELTLDRVTTAIGERRSLKLPDGSTVEMNVDTTVEIAYDEDRRDITLASGEAVFKVVHDSARPFIVHTPTASVRAVGTQFNVYQRRATIVSVLEGQVEVLARSGEVPGSPALPAAASLAAGEEAQVANGTVAKRVHADVAKTVAWREGRLYFDDMPLAEIVHEFNRHGGPVQLRVEGIAPQAYRFGGTFDADDPASLVEILERQADLLVERHAGEVVIRPAAPEAGG